VTARKPTRKVTAVGLGGAASVIIAWIGELAGLDVPQAVAAAAAVIVAWAAGYIVTD
jgi:NhaP-type Na+/H+ and K+/H+ antiporter